MCSKEKVLIASFTAPLAAEQVRLAEEYASAVSSALNPFVRSRSFAGCSAIILCPRNQTPAVIVTREEQRQSVNRVKGFILDTQKLLTLVSVTYGHKTEFVLIRTLLTTLISPKETDTIHCSILKGYDYYECQGTHSWIV